MNTGSQYYFPDKNTTNSEVRRAAPERRRLFLFRKNISNDSKTPNHYGFGSQSGFAASSPDGIGQMYVLELGGTAGTAAFAGKV